NSLPTSGSNRPTLSLPPTCVNSENNKKREQDLEIHITEPRVQEHLRHLVQLRIKAGDRYLIVKQNSPEIREENWYGKAMTAMFKKVFAGIEPSPKTVTDWRQIISQHGKDLARGDPEAEAAHNKRMNHSGLADDQ
ncbi:hypothetical protein HDV00_001819, partial [Rhizophlyctis rosea]